MGFFITRWSLQCGDLLGRHNNIIVCMIVSTWGQYYAVYWHSPHIYALRTKWKSLAEKLHYESYPKTNQCNTQSMRKSLLPLSFAWSALQLVHWRREGMLKYAEHVQQVCLFHGPVKFSILFSGQKWHIPQLVGFAACSLSRFMWVLCWLTPVTVHICYRLLLTLFGIPVVNQRPCVTWGAICVFRLHIHFDFQQFPSWSLVF